MMVVTCEGVELTPQDFVKVYSVLRIITKFQCVATCKTCKLHNSDICYCELSEAQRIMKIVIDNVDL